MRLSVEIDERLMNEAMRAAGTKTKRETVERALKLVIAIKRQEEIRRFRGKLKSHSGLETTR